MCKCNECAYVAENEGRFFCNFGDSDRYELEVDATDECPVGETLEDLEKTDT